MSNYFKRLMRIHTILAAVDAWSDEEVAGALLRMLPREAHLLNLRYFRLRDDLQCAALYALTAAQWQWLHEEALNAALTTLRGGVGPGPAAPQHKLSVDRAQLAVVLEARADAIEAAYQQALDAHFSSGAQRRWEWARRAGMVAILALSAWFYVRERRGPTSETLPSPKTRVSDRP